MSNIELKSICEMCRHKAIHKTICDNSASEYHNINFEEIEIVECDHFFHEIDEKNFRYIDEYTDCMGCFE